MPYDDPEPDDPHLLVGVSLPGDEASTREMAAAFADEFAQMGFDRERLLQVFASPFYAGAHAARELLGDPEIARIVDDSLRVYGGRRYAVKDGEACEERERVRVVPVQQSEAGIHSRPSDMGGSPKGAGGCFPVQYPPESA